MNEKNNGTELFVFTGTGNSLDAARNVLAGLGGGSITMINARMLEKKRILSEAGLVGFVFPVYYLGMPDPVRDFISRIELPGECRIFALATCGKTEGPVLDDVRTLLEGKGHALESGFIQYMPGNSIIFYNSEEEQKQMLSSADGRFEEIARMVREGEVASEGRSRSWHRGAARVTRWGFENLYRVGKKNARPDDCTGCGICARVCPMENIELEAEGEEKAVPRWKENCADCFACIHWCPSRAVRAGRLKISPERVYTHPRAIPGRQGVSARG